MNRKSVVLVMGMLVAALSAGGEGVANADRPLPRLTVYSENLGTFGDHDYCRGAVHVGLTAPTAKRGIVRLTLRSHGFTGNGIGWKRNPHCRALLVVATTSGAAPYKETLVPVSFGAKAGERVVRDIRSGSGPVNVGITPYATTTPVRTPQGQGVGAIVLVP